MFDKKLKLGEKAVDSIAHVLVRTMLNGEEVTDLLMEIEFREEDGVLYPTFVPEITVSIDKEETCDLCDCDEPREECAKKDS